MLLLCGQTLGAGRSGAGSGQGALGAASQGLGVLRRGDLQSLEEILGLAAVAAGLIISLFAALMALLSAGAVAAGRLGALRAETLLNTLSPAFMRRTLIVTLSAQLALVGTALPQDHAQAAQAESVSAQSVAIPAQAEPAAPTPLFSTDGPAPGTENTMTPLFTPTAPAAPAERHQGAEQRQSPEDEDSITVRPGDTLWGLVAAELGPGATDWEIARDWPQWYEHNRSVIGEDPGELAPGTVLQKPQPAR